MTFQEVKEIIGSFGFPIFVACYLLYERHSVGRILISRMDKLLTLLESLERKIQR